MMGVVVVDKPKGISSHDAVNAVRRLASTRRVGHTGTLDPLATGVLVMLIGPATRLSRFATQSSKSYRGTIRLGVTTSTYDAEGEPLECHPVDLDLIRIRQVLPKFTGTVEQVPPRYSAIKMNGRKLYELAREGKVVHPRSRTVTIYAIDILDWAQPDLTVAVRCSSGTYIRSLAHDLGQRLGCGAHLLSLRRTQNGPFTIAQSHTLEQLGQLRDAGSFADAVLPPQTILDPIMPVTVLTSSQTTRVRHGQELVLETDDKDGFVQAHDEAGSLIAVLARLDDHTFRPKVVLPSVGRP
jgi:tRNA pseudouridine55 synthase